MTLWKFGRENSEVAAGANTVAGVIKGGQAPFVGGDFGAAAAEKRNVILTSSGWVRRENRGSTHGGNRTIDQIIVAANPGAGLTYGANTYTGKPDITQIYVKLNANGYISANATNANLYIVFNTPLHFKPSGNLISVLVSNTAGGNHAVGLFANTAAQGRIINANNTLVFRLPKLQGGAGSVAATYHVNAQALVVAGGGNPLYNPDHGTTKVANLVLSGATSNTLLNGIGQKITNFQVRRNG